MAKNKSTDTLELEVNLIRRDIEAINDYVKQNTKVIDQLKDLAGGIAQMIAIHEEKHNQNDKDHDRNDRDFANLQEKLEQTKEQLHQRISSTETTLLQRLDQMATKLDGRVNDLEKWKWKVVAVISAGGILFTALVNLYPIVAPFFTHLF